MLKWFVDFTTWTALDFSTDTSSHGPITAHLHHKRPTHHHTKPVHATSLQTECLSAIHPPSRHKSRHCPCHKDRRVSRRVTTEHHQPTVGYRRTTRPVAVSAHRSWDLLDRRWDAESKRSKSATSNPPMSRVYSSVRKTAVTRTSANPIHGDMQRNQSQLQLYITKMSNYPTIRCCSRGKSTLVANEATDVLSHKQRLKQNKPTSRPAGPM